MNSPDLEEQLEADVYSNFPCHNEDSTGPGVMTRRNRSTCRSKHSETEQRRRCKINERFQALMDIVPQNDQKRDKASFLLEVIEYIHFLQEKVQLHEGSHQMWYQPPTKLIPWRNNHQPVTDHPQFLKSNDKVAASSGLLFDVQNSTDPDIDSPAGTKILQHSPSSALSSLLQFVQHAVLQPRQSSGSVNCNTNELLNLDLKTPATFSTVFSQRVLHTLTKALKSSGVNMSETLISVQLSLRKRADCEHSVTAFASEDYCNSNADEEGASQTETRSFCKELDHSQKRIRR